MGIYLYYRDDVLENVFISDYFNDIKSKLKKELIDKTKCLLFMTNKNEIK